MGNVVSRMRQLDAAGHPYDLSGYDAFGSRYLYTCQQNQPVPPDAVGYGGQWGNYTDVEANLVLMGFRFYSPQYCRFLTRDPQGYEGGINLYAYCRNNPINCFDPLGLDKDYWSHFNQFVSGVFKQDINAAASDPLLAMIPGPGTLIFNASLTGWKPFQLNSEDEQDGANFETAAAFFASFFVGGEANATQIVKNEGSLSLMARMRNKVFTYVWEGTTKIRHQASIRVTENGSTIFKTRAVSGMMTAEEKAMGQLGSFASHTEARACRKIPLNSGQTMYITSKSTPPCASCMNWMRTTAKATGAKIIYRWRSGGITHIWTP